MQARTTSTHAHCNTNAALCAQGHENQFQAVSAQNLHTTNKVDECQLADCGSAWVFWKSSYPRYGAVLTIYMCTFIVTQMWAEAELLFNLFIYLFISERWRGTHEQGTETPYANIATSWQLIQGCILPSHFCSWSRLQHLPMTPKGK